LQELFCKAMPGEGATKLDKYYNTIKALGKGNTAEKLIEV
jgi:hypothetical protein